MNVNMRNDRDVELQNASIRVINLGKAQVVVTPVPTMFHVLATGLPEDDTIDLDATLIGLVGNVVWSCSGGTLSGIAGPKAQLRYADMTGPVATVLATVTYAGQDVVGRASIAVVRDGATGATAKLITLDASAEVFKIDKAGANSPGSITLTATGQNLGGTPVFSPPAGVTLTNGVNGSQKILTFANMTVDSATISVTQDGVTDRVTIVKLREGLDGVSAVAGFLTNESVTVAATSAGAVGSLAAAGGTFRILDGVTDMTGNAAVAYSVPAETGVDVNIAATGVYTVASMSTDTGTATIRAVYKGVTIDRIYTIVKARAGADGSAPIFVDVSTSGGQMFSRATAAAAFAPTSLTLGSAVYGGTATAYQWQYWTGSAWTAIAGATASTYAVASGSFTGSRVFRLAATVGGASYFDEVTLVQVTGGTDGLDAITGVLTNELVALPADNAGNVSSVVGASCTLNIYKGITLDTGWAFAFAPASSASTLAYTANTSTGTVTVSSMAAGVDAAFVDITATKAGFGSVVKRFNVTKSKAGVQGQTGTGTPGTRGTVDIQATIAGTTWSATSATSALTAAGYGAPIKFDLVTLRNQAAGYIETRVWDGDSWESPGLILNGNLTAPGTILTTALAANAVTADKFDGRSIELKDATGNVTFSSNVPIAQQTPTNPNMAPGLRTWTATGGAAAQGNSINTVSGEYVHLPANSNNPLISLEVPVSLPQNGEWVTISCAANSLNNGSICVLDLFNGTTLTGYQLQMTPPDGGAQQRYSATFQLPVGVTGAKLRAFLFTRDKGAQMGDIKLEVGQKVTAWRDDVITAANASTYIQSAAIKFAHIDTASITNLSAINSYLGGVEIGPNGYIRQGMTGYGVGVGMWFGVHNGINKFIIGNPNGSMMWWDGSTLQVQSLGVISLNQSAFSVDISDMTRASSSKTFTANMTAAITGTGNFKSIQWFIEGTGLTLTNSTSQTVTIRSSVGAIPETNVGILKAVVVGLDGRSVSDECTVTMDHA